jgi:hypothetical protein
MPPSRLMGTVVPPKEAFVKVRDRPVGSTSMTACPALVRAEVGQPKDRTRRSQIGLSDREEVRPERRFRSSPRIDRGYRFEGRVATLFGLDLCRRSTVELLDRRGEGSPAKSSGCRRTRQCELPNSIASSLAPSDTMSSVRHFRVFPIRDGSKLPCRPSDSSRARTSAP